MIQIKNYPNYYITEEGEVYSSKNKQWLKKYLKGGYYAVTLRNENMQKPTRIHKIVAEHYLPKVEGKTQVNHIDGNKLNNSLSNLEWCTSAENQLHAYSTGLKKFVNNDYRKQRVKDATSKVVLDTSTGIFYDSISDAARILNKSRCHLRQILTGKLNIPTNLKLV